MSVGASQNHFELMRERERTRLTLFVRANLARPPVIVISKRFGLPLSSSIPTCVFSLYLSPSLSPSLSSFSHFLCPDHHRGSLTRLCRHRVQMISWNVHLYVSVPVCRRRSFILVIGQSLRPHSPPQPRSFFLLLFLQEKRKEKRHPILIGCNVYRMSQEREKC